MIRHLNIGLGMSPSVGGVLPREVLAGGMTIDGVHVPAGTVVGVPHYTIHHNENYYANSFSFIPERWLAGSHNKLTGKIVQEEDVIGRCLESVRHLVDEINIVDTGSTDRTKEIAANYTKRIFDFKWIDHFAAARNFSFQQATCDYILWLDEELAYL